MNAEYSAENSEVKQNVIYYFDQKSMNSDMSLFDLPANVTFREGSNGFGFDDLNIEGFGPEEFSSGDIDFGDFDFDW